MFVVSSAKAQEINVTGTLGLSARRGSGCAAFYTALGRGGSLSLGFFSGVGALLLFFAQLKDEVQHLGDGGVQLFWDFFFDVELVQRLGEGNVAQNRDARLARDGFDGFGVLAHALGDNARCAAVFAVVLDGNGDMSRVHHNSIGVGDILLTPVEQ